MWFSEEQVKWLQRVNEAMDPTIRQLEKTFQTEKDGYGSKLGHQGTAGFSLWFHLPGLHFGYLSLTHTQRLTSYPSPSSQ